MILPETIIDTVLLSSSADQVVVAPIINHTPLFERFGNPAWKFNLRSTSTITSALGAVVTSNKPDVVIYINTASLWVNCATYNVMSFDRFLLTGLICPTVPGTGTGTGAATYAAAAATTPAQIAAAATSAVSAANQALVAQQAAATAVIAATIPATFDLRNLPPVVKTCHLNQLDPSYLMTQDNMVLFPMATGGMCKSFSHLDQLMGTGVTRQPDSNQVIARNGQFYSLADQGNTGLKVFFASVPTCVGTSPEAIRI